MRTLRHKAPTDSIHAATCVPQVAHSLEKGVTSMKKFLSIVAILSLVFSPVTPAFAVDFDWNGAATPDTLFTTGGNWVGAAAPVAVVGGALSFDATGGANRTVTGANLAYSTISGISFTGALGNYSIAGAGSFSFDAGATITGDGDRSHTFNTLGIITTGAGITFSGASNYTVGGVVSGTILTVNLAGNANTLTLNGANSYTGITR